MLPSDFPPWNHVWYYYRTWRNEGTLEQISTSIRQEVRIKGNRDPEPSVGIIDSQSVATTEMGGEKGFNPHKQVKGRKRTILIDTLGLLLFVVVCAASIQDSDAAVYIIRETEGDIRACERSSLTKAMHNGWLSWPNTGSTTPSKLSNGRRSSEPLWYSHNAGRLSERSVGSTGIAC